jgi:hypothetical protein
MRTLQLPAQRRSTVGLDRRFNLPNDGWRRFPAVQCRAHRPGPATKSVTACTGNYRAPSRGVFSLAVKQMA